MATDVLENLPLRRLLAPALGCALLAALGSHPVSGGEAASTTDAARADSLRFTLSLARFDQMPTGSIRFFNEVLEKDYRGVSIHTLSAVRRESRRRLGFEIDGRLGTAGGEVRRVDLALTLVDDGEELEHEEVRGLELRPGQPTPFAVELLLSRKEFAAAFESGDPPYVRFVLTVRESE